MKSILQAGVHFRDALECLHLIGTHFVLRPQLTGYMHTSGIANRHYQTTPSQNVPSYHQSIVSVGLFS